MNFSLHQASHIGNRKFNQDRVAHVYNNDALLVLLADGMGGHLHGELAASTAIATFIEAFANAFPVLLDDPDLFLRNVMLHAHGRVLCITEESRRDDAPGTTCVAAMIKDGVLHFGHAGDSRLYLLRDGQVFAKTQDHSLVSHWMQWGMMTSEQARVHPQRNQITNCLGGAEDVFFIEMGEPILLQPGDVLLLGSDGLWSPFSDEELVAAFHQNSVDHTLDNLIAIALQREHGRSDNVTGLVLRWHGQ